MKGTGTWVCNMAWRYPSVLGSTAGGGGGGGGGVKRPATGQQHSPQHGTNAHCC